MAKKALGKGLGALIKAPTPKGSSVPSSQSASGKNASVSPVDPTTRVQEISLSEIVSSPFQPRKVFRDGQLDELVDSIRQHGIIQPLVVREVGGKKELIAGERRWRASQKLGLKTVPVVTKEASDKDVLEMALIENLQREDLNPIEEAQAYTRLADEFSLTQEDIAKRVGKNRATVANVMRLLDLDSDVRSLLATGRITSGHAKVLLAVREPEKQRILADEVVRKSLTVRAVERLVALDDSSSSKSSVATSQKLRSKNSAATEALSKKLQDRYGTKVSIQHTEKKGKIELEYYGLDDLDRVLGLMGLPASSD